MIITSQNKNSQLPVVVFGSAFDPPHWAHAASIILAHTYVTNKETLQKNSELQKEQSRSNCAQPNRLQKCEVWLYPSPARWDKTPHMPLERRVKLTRLLAHWLREKKVDALVANEETKNKHAYLGTTRLMKNLLLQHPSRRFFLLCGEDSLRSMPQWKDAETGELNGNWLLENIEILVVPRSYDKPSPETAVFSENPLISDVNLYEDLMQTYSKVTLLPSLHFFPKQDFGIPSEIPLHQISSSLLREQLALGRGCANLTIPSIVQYLEKPTRKVL